MKELGLHGVGSKRYWKCLTGGSKIIILLLDFSVLYEMTRIREKLEAVGLQATHAAVQVKNNSTLDHQHKF